MRILIFTQQLAAFRSGVGTYAYGLITGMGDRGHQITAVVPKREKTEIAGVKITAVPNPWYDPTPGGWLGLGLIFARILSAKGHRYDIAHFTDAREAWCVRHSPIPATGMVNDSYALDWIKSDYPRRFFKDSRMRGLYYAFLRSVEKRTYGRLSAVIANSSHTARAITDSYSLDSKKVEVIRYGLFQQRPCRPIPLGGKPAILFAGGNFQRKGLAILLNAVARLVLKFPDIRLHIVGSDRNQPLFVTQSCRLGIIERVKFHGWQPNEKVAAMMAGADLFALPSFTEGFGLVYLEAMRAGTPVIAASRGGAREVFRQDEEALFVKPGDTQGLALAIEKIASGKEIADGLRKNGQAAARRFTAETMAQETEKLFQKIISLDIRGV